METFDPKFLFKGPIDKYEGIDTFFRPLAQFLHILWVKNKKSEIFLKIAFS